LPFGAFLRSLFRRNGRAFSSLTGKAGGLLQIQLTGCDNPKKQFSTKLTADSISMHFPMSYEQGNAE
jgi:hypothetical protein